jgi:hypothetical protein
MGHLSWAGNVEATILALVTLVSTPEGDDSPSPRFFRNQRQARYAQSLPRGQLVPRRWPLSVTNPKAGYALTRQVLPLGLNLRLRCLFSASRERRRGACGICSSCLQTLSSPDA